MPKLTRRSLPLLIAGLAVAACAATASAQNAPRQKQPPAAAPEQQPAATPKPYKPVTLTAPAPFNDAALATLRQQIGDAAKRRDRNALAKFVVATGFYWEGENGDAADKTKSGIDNLTKALDLGAKDGYGWDLLAGFAAEPTASAIPERQGHVCTPADPGFNEQDFGALVQSSGTDPSDWGYPLAPSIEVRGAPQPNAPVIDKLGMHFVWVMPDNSSAATAPMLRIVLPSGKYGYVAADTVAPLGGDQLCFAKDAGGWKITGFIGGSQQQQ